MEQKTAPSLGKALPAWLVLTGTIAVMAFVFGQNSVKKQKPAQYPVEMAQNTAQERVANSEQVSNEFTQQLDELPVNPTAAVATCTIDNSTIVSDTQTNCANPSFTWSGASGGSNQSNVIGYNVYWVQKTSEGDVRQLLPEHPLANMMYGYNRNSTLSPTFVPEARFTPDVPLVTGQTYYLLVQTVTDSLHPLLKLGGSADPQNPRNIDSANVLFTYIY